MPASTLAAVFARDLDAAARTVEAYLSDEALWTVLPGTANSGGVLARHLAGNLRHFVGQVLGGSGYLRNRDDEFSPQTHSRAEVAAELRRAAADCEATLSTLSDEVLQRPFPLAIAGVSLSTEAALLHIATHLTYHLGQMDYHRRVLDVGAKPIAALSLEPLRGH